MLQKKVQSRKSNNKLDRMCISCKIRLPKAEMTRVCKTASGDIFVDNTNKASGRGAYVCKNKECLDSVFKKRGLNRAFKGNVSEGVYLELIGS